MKNRIIPVLFALALLAFAACKKSSTTTPDPVMARGMSAKINGVPWVAQWFSYESTIGGTNDVIFSGYDSTGRSIEFRINNFKNRGTYNIPQKNDSAFYALDYNVFSSPEIATTGKVSIQALTDSTVGGTFSFSTANYIVTEGSFNVLYQ